MVDAAVASGRPARLVWDVPGQPLAERIARWSAAGVQVTRGPGAAPDEDGSRWWYAGDGPRVDAVLTGLVVPPERVERFYLDIEDTHDLLHEVFPGSDLDG